MYRSHAIATCIPGVVHRPVFFQQYRKCHPLGTYASSCATTSHVQFRMSITTASKDRSAQGSSAPLKMQIVSADECVTAQRLNRPVSPHMRIYSWEIMICGALHRNTGILLSGSLYIFGFLYLALPGFGLPMGSAELVSWFGSLPIVVRIAIKWIYGFAFSFHLAHGMRHLIWDTGAMLKNSQVKKTGVAALVVGTLGATGLCFM